MILKKDKDKDQERTERSPIDMKDKKDMAGKNTVNACYISAVHCFRTKK